MHNCRIVVLRRRKSRLLYSAFLYCFDCGSSFCCRKDGAPICCEIKCWGGSIKGPEVDYLLPANKG